MGAEHNGNKSMTGYWPPHPITGSLSWDELGRAVNALLFGPQEIIVAAVVVHSLLLGKPSGG